MSISSRNKFNNSLIQSLTITKNQILYNILLPVIHKCIETICYSWSLYWPQLTIRLLSLHKCVHLQILNINFLYAPLYDFQAANNVNEHLSSNQQPQE
jgi:hypothetical protein